MNQNALPSRWGKERVAKNDAAFGMDDQTLMEIPGELLSALMELLAARKAS